MVGCLIYLPTKYIEVRYLLAITGIEAVKTRHVYLPGECWKFLKWYTLTSILLGAQGNDSYSFLPVFQHSVASFNVLRLRNALGSPRVFLLPFTLSSAKILGRQILSAGGGRLGLAVQSL